MADKIPEQQRGFIDGGSCGQALLALLTVAQRGTKKRTFVSMFCRYTKSVSSSAPRNLVVKNGSSRYLDNLDQMPLCIVH